MFYFNLKNIVLLISGAARLRLPPPCPGSLRDVGPDVSRVQAAGHGAQQGVPRSDAVARSLLLDSRPRPSRSSRLDLFYFIVFFL